MSWSTASRILGAFSGMRLTASPLTRRQSSRTAGWKILLRRDTGELGELEVDRAEAVEEADEAVAEGEVDGAKGTPGWGEGAVEFFVADAAEELGVGGGAASGRSRA